MQNRHPYRGLTLALFLLISTFGLLLSTPSAVAAVGEYAASPIQVSMKQADVNNWNSKVLNSAALISWSGNISASRNNTIQVGYQSSGDVGSNAVLFDRTATLYYTTDGSAPTTGGLRLNLTARPAQGSNTPAPMNPQIYSGNLSTTALSSAHTVRFMIQVRQVAATTNQVSNVACDLGGFSATGARADRFKQGAQGPDCPPTAPLNRGFQYQVDRSAPALDFNSISPKWDPGWVHPAKAGKVVVGSTTQKLASFDVTSSSQNTTSLFNSKLNLTANVWANVTGAGPKVCLFGPTCTAGNPAKMDRQVLNNGYTFRFTWKTGVAANWTKDLDYTLDVNITDYAGAKVSLSGKTFILHVDQKVPNPVNVPASNQVATPSRLEVVGEEPNAKEVTVTGIGATLEVRVSVTDLHVNGTTANRTGGNPSVQVILFGEDGDGDETRIFESAVFAVPFHSVNTANPNLPVTTFRGNVTILPKAGTTAPTTDFCLALNVTVIDAGGNLKKLDAPSGTTPCAPDDVCPDGCGPGFFLIRPGAPEIEVTQTLTAVGSDNWVGPGPHTVKANVTDDDPGVDLVKVRMTLLEGGLSISGWVNVAPNTWERTMDRSGDSFTGVIPVGNHSTKATWQIRAQDQRGNVAITPAAAIRYDASVPTINHSNPAEWRGIPSHSINFTAFDTGSGLDNTTGEMFYCVGTTCTPNILKPMTFNNGVLTAIMGGQVQHESTVRFFGHVLDAVGNRGINASAAAPLSYMVDMEPPETTIGPLDATSATGLVTLTALATDDGSGLGAIIFEGRFKREGDTAWSAWLEVARSAADGNETADAASGELCLGGGVDYEFRAVSLDVAGNRGDPDGPRALKVTGAGCVQTVTVTIQQPPLSSGFPVDGQDGTGKIDVLYAAVPSGAFTSRGLITVKIEISLENDPLTPLAERRWFLLADNVPNTGAYRWTVDAPSCGACMFRITGKLPDGTTGVGHSAAFEILNGSANTDFDNNKVSDECELKYFGGLGLVDRDGDDDGDGLTNGQECSLGTNPSPNGGFDTDGDGVSDGVEVETGHDPLDANDTPSPVDRRSEQFEPYFFIVPALFVAVSAVFLLGVTRRW